MISKEIGELSRSQLVDETIQAFVDLVLTEKFADMPDWMNFDLTVSQVRAIYLLAYHTSMTVSGLARALGMGNPAASILVQQLVEQELVDRSVDIKDRRRVLVRLTKRGAELVRGRRDLREAKFRRRLSELSDDELAGLLRGVDALARVVRSERADLAENA